MSTKHKQELPGNVVSPDPFADLSKFRVSTDYAGGVKKLLLKVPVRKPHRQEFIRVHPDNEFCLDTTVIEVSEDREYFLVGSEIRDALPDECKLVRLHTTINRQGVVTLWPIRLADSDGRINPWHQSALDIAEIAKVSWVRLAADRSLGGYQCHQASGDLPDPTWPEKPFNELVKIAFANGYLISDPEHPVIRRLLGKV